jgi:fructose-specific phosphotransferase system IIA component
MAATLREMLNPVCIDLELKGKRKPEIIEALAELLGRGGKVSDTGILAAEVLEREKLASTGIGSGIAIPHAMSSTVSETQLAFGLKREGVRFDSVDHRPVNLFFLLVGPAGSHTEHLRVLSRIARYLHDSRFCDALKEADSPEAVMAAVEEKERDS